MKVSSQLGEELPQSVGGEGGSVLRSRRETTQPRLNVLRGEPGETSEFQAAHSLGQPRTTCDGGHASLSLELNVLHDTALNNGPKFHYITAGGVRDLNRRGGMQNLANVAGVVEMVEELLGIHEASRQMSAVSRSGSIVHGTFFQKSCGKYVGPSATIQMLRTLMANGSSGSQRPIPRRGTHGPFAPKKTNFRPTTIATPAATISATLAPRFLFTSGIRSEAATYSVTPAERAKPKFAQRCASPI